MSILFWGAWIISGLITYVAVMLGALYCIRQGREKVDIVGSFLAFIFCFLPFLGFALLVFTVADILKVKEIEYKLTKWIRNMK